MNILIAGQKWFGAEVFTALRALPGVSISAVCAPSADKLSLLADRHRVPVIPAGTLNAGSMPLNIDLIVAAHSHDFIGERTRLRASFGGIGYHPSLLPIHRGRDAVRWALRMGDKVTGVSAGNLSAASKLLNAITIEDFDGNSNQLDEVVLKKKSALPASVVAF